MRKMNQPPTLSMILVIFLLQSGLIYSQITISANDFPVKAGTLVITEDDTVNDVIFTAGLPGENQVWYLNEPLPSQLMRQMNVPPDSAMFHTHFPDADIATHFVGRFGSFIHSYYLDEIYGDMYAFQYLKNDSLMFSGLGVKRSEAKRDNFLGTFSGSIPIKPAMLMYPFPLHYEKEWESVVEATARVDTVLYGFSTTATLAIRDSSKHLVDGWGKLVLPTGEYECLRIKTYHTIIEKLYIHTYLYRTRKMWTIQYSWLSKEFGVLARVISHSKYSDPGLDDNFSRAKQVSRLRYFNPKIELSMPDTVGRRLINLPVYISDCADLNITQLDFRINYDNNVIRPMKAYNNVKGLVTENWDSPEYLIDDSGIRIIMKGDKPLTGTGIVCYIRFSISPSLKTNLMSDLILKDVKVAESGPMVVTKPGKFNKIFFALDKYADNEADPDESELIPTQFELFQNFPNPFNMSTTIRFDLPKAAQIKLSIFDIKGREIRQLFSGLKSAGTNSIQWDGCDKDTHPVAAGLYFCYLEAQSDDLRFTDMKKMALIK